MIGEKLRRQSTEKRNRSSKSKKGFHVRGGDVNAGFNHIQGEKREGEGGEITQNGSLRNRGLLEKEKKLLSKTEKGGGVFGFFQLHRTRVGVKATQKEAEEGRKLLEDHTISQTTKRLGGGLS